MPSKRSHLNCTVHNGKIYLVGGREFSYVFYDILVYYVASDSYLEPITLSERTAFSDVCSIGDALYVFGGIDEAGIPTSNLHKFDLCAREWTEVISAPATCFAHVVCSANWMLRVFSHDIADRYESTTTGSWRYCCSSQTANSGVYAVLQFCCGQVDVSTACATTTSVCCSMCIAVRIEDMQIRSLTSNAQQHNS